MKDIDNEVKMYFQELQHRPLMFFAENPGILEYKSLINGYIHGIDTIYEKRTNFFISKWLQKKLNLYRNLIWTDLILYYYKDRSEEEKKLLLLDTLEKFFNEHPNWFGNSNS